MLVVNCMVVKQADADRDAFVNAVGLKGVFHQRKPLFAWRA